MGEIGHGSEENISSLKRVKEESVNVLGMLLMEEEERLYIESGRKGSYGGGGYSLT
ncbi:hypothetical protein SAY87_020387 [Trapa incisa]|uniref:Uncharacterized protein n=1 Tax=Trapa incisa TaxID=236973 RepID=A0AAN7K3F3_9MYRT|nr:hypothetical protein SAY87_020387 [Trapa incisa]